MAKFLDGYEGIQVLGARAVIKLEKESDTTASGIILPTGDKDPKFEGVVVAIGDGQRKPDGGRIPMDVEPGQRVIYSRMAGVPVSLDGEEFLVINERDIIAVITK
ncbi:GroES [Bacillus phage 0305phi8-36]|uniref:co-chaperonin GroES n=1 Tax=Bacillus phage 0305phi8-36 TaxID=458639 RepID=UPI00015A1F85|nr:co-chaperonin GroES [Bacillus phage 0305phi8-36]ABS83602.1 GroES [Bacillus phage 0305phi8-36]